MFFLQDCQKEVETLTQDLVQSKRNYDAVKARNTTLSSEMKTLRAQVAALVEKGRNDDNLITQLLDEKVTIIRFNNCRNLDRLKALSSALKALSSTEIVLIAQTLTITDHGMMSRSKLEGVGE